MSSMRPKPILCAVHYIFTNTGCTLFWSNNSFVWHDWFFRISVMRMIVRLQMKMMMQTFQWCEIVRYDLQFCDCSLFLWYTVTVSLTLFNICRMLRTRIGQQKHPSRHLQRRRPGWQLHLRATILLWNVTFEVLIVKLLTLPFLSMPPKSHFLMNFPFRQWHWYKKCLCPCGHPLSIQVREEPALLKRRTPSTSDKPIQTAANLAAGNF